MTEKDVSLKRQLTLTRAGSFLIVFWVVLIVGDIPGVFWDEGGRMILELYDPISLINPLSVGLTLLGFGALGGKKKEQQP